MRYIVSVMLLGLMSASCNGNDLADGSAVDLDEPPNKPIVPESPKSLFEIAASGDAEAQYFYGEKLYAGEGVGRDILEAEAWWRRAAAQDHVKAKVALASLYLEGLGAHGDKEKAFALLKEAAQSGDKFASEVLDSYGIESGSDPEPKSQQ